MNPLTNIRWSPRRFIRMRRARIIITALLVTALGCGFIFANIRKTVSLEVNGTSREVTTYALTVDRLLDEQGIAAKTHDQVISSSGPWLSNHSVVTVRQAYQVILSIDGKQIPYWTVASSMGQLASYFESSQKNAAKVTVNIANVYQQLTGGLIINKDGPVTVVADGKESIAPDGRLPAASILDSKGITLGREDRAEVDTENNITYLRIKRVTHGTTSRVVPIAFQNITVDDPNLTVGTTQKRQDGSTGEETQTLSVTYVDGVADTEEVTGSSVTKAPVNEITAVGTKQPDPTPAPTPAQTQSNNQSSSTPNQNTNTDNNSNQNSNNQSNSQSETNSQNQSQQNSQQETPQNNANNNSSSSNSAQSQSQSQSQTQTQSESSQANNTQSNNQTNNQSSNNSNNSSSNSQSSSSSSNSSSNSNSSMHLTPSEAQSLAQGMARDFYGWGSSEFNCLVTLWNYESGWRWDAANPWSDAYGIPQALPGSKMGTGWHDDATVQIAWGLSYIKNNYNYGSPCAALSKWQSRLPHWY